MSSAPPPRIDASAWRALGVVSMATFMSALDGSVVNVALPTIRTEFGAPVASMEWVVMVYMLCISALLLPFGRLGDVIGHARLMGLGFVSFGAASVACGAAPGLWSLVVARGLQGVGAALLMATGPALLTTRFPPQARGRALGLLATATYLGLTLGPSLGGLITEHLGWRWTFWVNLPIAVPAAFALLRIARAEKPNEKQRAGIDVLSAVLFAVTIVGAILALQQSGHNAMTMGALGTAALVCGVAFVWRQHRIAVPLLPLELFKSTAFSAGMGAAYLQYLVLFTANFLVPFFLQGPGGMSPDRAGLVMTAQPLAMVALTALAGHLSDRIGARIPSALGMALVAIAAWLLSSLDPASPSWHAALVLGLLGVGAGFFTSPNNSAILGAAPRERQGVASGLLAAARNVGMVSGIALAGAFLGAAGASHAQAHDLVAHAFRNGLRVAAVIAALGFLLALLRPSPRRA